MKFKEYFGANLVLGILLLLIILVIGYYNWFFWDHPLSHDSNDWGPVGDFFGGILNPIITGFTLIFIVKTFTQNERLLKHSIQEMKFSKEEITRAREIQQESAIIEKQSLELSRIDKAEQLYTQSVSVIRKEIEDLLNTKSITKVSNGQRYILSINDYLVEGSIITLDSLDRNKIAIMILEQAINSAIKLCNQIPGEVLLNDSPHKKHLVDIQKSLSGKLLNDLAGVLSSVQVVDASGATNLKDIKELYSNLLNELKDSMDLNEVSPYINYKIRKERRSKKKNETMA